MQHLLPSQKLWGSLFQRRLWHTGHLGHGGSSKGPWTLLFFPLWKGHPQKTSSVNNRYHLISSLNSSMLFANKCGSPPAGRLFCSAQCWRALAYATTFSLGISLLSWQANVESAGSMNLCLHRHGGAGGAWRVVSLEPNSCNCHGSPKDALTFLASFLVSSFPGTANSSNHHSGVSHLSSFHGTHWPKSKIMGSRGIFSPSSSEVSGNPHRKEATIGFSSGSSPKSEPPPLDPSSPDCVLGSADWLETCWSLNQTV